MRLKSPISYYGGKSSMVPSLEPIIPPHKTYVEAFVGGGSLFFAKQPSPVEVINDLNGFVAAFYRTIKNNFDALNELIQSTLYDEHTNNYYREIYRKRMDSTDLQKAYALWIGANMSFGGSVYDGSFAITSNSNAICNPATKLAEKRRRFLTFSKRLEKTMILEKDAIVILKKYNNNDTFIYCDPPYVGANQGHYKGYKLKDFTNLLETASLSKSKIMISCYWHDCIDDFDFIIDSKKTKTRIISTDKTEIILRNYKIENTLFSL